MARRRLPGRRVAPSLWPPPRGLPVVFVEPRRALPPLLPAPGAPIPTSGVQAAEVPHDEGLDQQDGHGGEQQQRGARPPGQPAGARVHVCACVRGAQTAGWECCPERGCMQEEEGRGGGGGGNLAAAWKEESSRGGGGRAGAPTWPFTGHVWIPRGLAFQHSPWWRPVRPPEGAGLVPAVKLTGIFGCRKFQTNTEEQKQLFTSDYSLVLLKQLIDCQEKHVWAAVAQWKHNYIP